MTSEYWYFDPAALFCEVSLQLATQRQQLLTKPPGSLGRLEQLAIKLAALQHTPNPVVNGIAISIFAADHGVALENVSAFPQVVTGEMVRNFAGGGAAIAVMARHLGAQMRVANLGTVNPLEPIAGVEDCRIAAGTANLLQQPAMIESQLQQALAIGCQHAEDAKQARCNLLIGGEMGIGNTTSATALACSLLQKPAQVLVGPGTGISDDRLQHKRYIIDAALERHGFIGLSNPDPMRCLRTYGGFEIAALTGSYLRAGQLGVTALVDGYIASVAALAAVMINPSISPWLLLSHRSAEPGHQFVIEALVERFQFSPPLVELDMRLGEASGAAVVVPLLQLACALHNEMATFDSAQVTNQL